MDQTTHSTYRDAQTSAESAYVNRDIVNTNKRNKTVDLVRLFAAYGVIAIHVPYSTAAAESLNLFFSPLCVPFFYVVSLVFFTSGLQQVSIHTILLKTWRRILLPYLMWTTIYTGLILIKKVLTGASSEIIPWRVLFYGESAVHLYFLPTLILLQFITLAILLIVTPRFAKQGLGFTILTIALLYLIWGNLNDCYGVASTGQIIGMAAYITTAFWLCRKIQIGIVRPDYIVAGILLITAAVCLNFFGYTLSVLNYPLIFPIGGIGLLLFAVGMPINNLPKWLSGLSSASFGIYLSHVLFLEAFEFALEKVFSVSVNYTLALKIAEVTLIFILASILTFTLKKIPICKQVFLGE